MEERWVLSLRLAPQSYQTLENEDWHEHNVDVLFITLFKESNLISSAISNLEDNTRRRVQVVDRGKFKCTRLFLQANVMGTLQWLLPRRLKYTVGQAGLYGHSLEINGWFRQECREKYRSLWGKKQRAVILFNLEKLRHRQSWSSDHDTQTTLSNLRTILAKFIPRVWTSHNVRKNPVISYKFIKFRH